jgi:hypothetical protein
MRLRLAVAFAAVVAAALPLLSCLPVRGPSTCDAPYGSEPMTLSHMVKNPPLSSAFACAMTVWTLATAEWLAAEGRALRWAVLVFGLAFGATPTGALPEQWVTHTALLGCLVVSLYAATAGLADPLPPAERRRAREHRAASLLWGAAGVLLILCVYPAAGPLDLLGGYGVAACEIAGCVHMAAFQMAVMRPFDTVAPAGPSSAAPRPRDGRALA